MYEYLDTGYGIKGNVLALCNLSFRMVVSGGYLSITNISLCFVAISGSWHLLNVFFFGCMSAAAAVAALRLIAVDSNTYDIFAD